MQRRTIITLFALVAVVYGQGSTSTNNVDWYSSNNVGRSTWFGGTDFTKGFCSYQTNPFGNLVFPAAIDSYIYDAGIPAGPCGQCMLVTNSNPPRTAGGTTQSDDPLPPGNKPTIVWVVDYCGGCDDNGANPGFDFYASGSGAWYTNWTAIDCPVDAGSGNPNGNVLINYVFQGGANAYYQKLQLVGSRLPVNNLSFYDPDWANPSAAQRVRDNFWVGGRDTSKWTVLNIEFSTATTGEKLRDTIPLASGGQTPPSASGKVQFKAFRPDASVPAPPSGGNSGGNSGGTGTGGGSASLTNWLNW